MIETIIAFSRYFVALLFGAAVDAAALLYGCLLYFAGGQLVAVGMDVTIKIYPLLSHLPVFAFVVIFLNRSWPVGLTIVFVSFLCCQAPRWTGAVAGEVFNSASADHLGYIIAALLMYHLLQKHVIVSARYLMERSVKSCFTTPLPFTPIFCTAERVRLPSSCSLWPRRSILCLYCCTTPKCENR